MKTLITFSNQLIKWCWQQRNVLEAPTRLIFALLWIYVGATHIYGNESPLRWLWLIPIAMNVSVFRSMWNPFRVLCIVAIWFVAMGAAMQSGFICSVAALIFVASLVGWYYLIQKPSDSALQHNLLEKKKHFHMQNLNG